MDDQTHPHHKRALEEIERENNTQGALDAPGTVGGSNYKRVDQLSVPSTGHTEETDRIQESYSSTQKLFEEYEQFRRFKESRGISAPSMNDSTMDMEEKCPYGCEYVSRDGWLMKAHLSQCPQKDPSASHSISSDSSGTNQNLHVKYLKLNYARQVEAISDDNLNVIAECRVWAIPASKEAIHAKMPLKAEPVRYNYNTMEWGLVVNNPKPVIALHDRTNTNISLNMFTNNALAKNENVSSFKPSKGGVIMNQEYEPIKKSYLSRQAANNVRALLGCIFPLDKSPETLVAVIDSQMLSQSYMPTPMEISSFFQHWVQERATAAVEGRSPPGFLQMQSFMHSLCQQRGPVVYDRNEERVDRGKRDRSRSGPQSVMDSRPFKKSSHSYDSDRRSYRKSSRDEDYTCIHFNSPEGCNSGIPAGGACSGKNIRWKHVCNYFDGHKMCLMPHSVIDHK